MESSSLVHHPLAAPPLLDDPLPQIQDHAQHKNLRIPPLRDAVPSRSRPVPSPLEPNTTGAQEPNVSKAGFGGNPPSELPTLEDFLHAARSKSFMGSSPESLLNPEPPPKTILPAFINLRAVEKLPYASFDEEVPRKRRRMDVNGDVFGEHLQLPVPQNQKEKKLPPFGPLTILNGLNEPPPNAAMFPPIEPDAIHQILTRPTRNTPPPTEPIPWDDQRQWEPEIGTPEDKGVPVSSSESRVQTEKLNGGPDTVSRQNSESKEVGSPGRKTPGSDGEPQAPATTTANGRARKKLRKWTEEETNDLLRGVVKCGIGNWTTILAQPELKFNGRSAANLKDRFRVCCPWAYGASDASVATKAVQSTLANALSDDDPKAAENDATGASTASTASNPSTPPKTSPALSDAGSGSQSPQPSSAAPTESAPDSSSTATKPRSRNKYPPTFKTAPTLSHKSKSTLVSLGVSEPYFTIKSTRRSRRPFTPVEDEALIKGYSVHGFQWTQIQQDKELNLSHRKATDLRDRFRTKFPDIYKEGGIPQPKPSPEMDRRASGTTYDIAIRNGSANRAGEKRGSPTSSTYPNSDPGTRPTNPQSREPVAPTRNTTGNNTERRKSTADSPIETSLPILRSIPPPEPSNPAPSTTSLFQFSDENTSGSGVGGGVGNSNSNVDSLAWGDGPSLPSLIWDEIA